MNSYTGGLIVRFFYTVRLVVSLIILGALFSMSVQITQADGLDDIGYPFAPCETWYVYQGYLSGSHSGVYAFDFVKDDPGDVVGSGGVSIFAAATGRFRKYRDGDNDNASGVQITLEDGTVVNYGHLNFEDVPDLEGTIVQKGTFIGTIFDKEPPPGGVYHLHFDVSQNGVTIPLDFGVWNYPSPGPLEGGNGEWSGTEIKTSCVEGHIDTPTDNAIVAGTSLIEGWAKIQGSAIDRIEIWIDGNYQGDATYGLPRPDVGGDYGYQWPWDTTTYPNGIHTIQVNAVAANGESAFLPQNGQTTIQVDVQNHDTTPPITSIELDGQSGNDGWYLTPVEITLTATDDLAGVQETNYRINGGAWQVYQAPLTLIDEGITTFEFRSIDQAGNVEPTQQRQIKIDTRPPLVDTWTDQANYTRIEPFIVRYTVSDPEPGSGLDTVVATFDGQTVIADQTIDLFWADLGSYTFEVTASDYAGWTTADQASFNLIATLDSLLGTVDRLCELGDIDNQGVCKALSQKLEHALQKREAGQIKVATNTLKAFIKQVEVQAGKHISARGADILLMDAQYVIEHLN